MPGVDIIYHSTEEWRNTDVLQEPMARHIAATTSSTVRITDPEAVRALCEHYSFGELTWTLTDDDHFSLCGYDRPEACRRIDATDPNPEPDSPFLELVRHLAPALAPREVLDIQSAGFEKLRLPLYGRRIVVSSARIRVWRCFAFPESRHSPQTDDLQPAETIALDE